MNTAATPVPYTTLLTRRIRLAKVTITRADAEAAEARTRLADLEAEYRTLTLECVA